MRRAIRLQTPTVFGQRWRKNFFQIFIVHWVNDVKQTEIHTPEPLVPELSAFEFKMAIENLKK